MINELTSRGTLLSLILGNEEKLVIVVKTGDSLGCIDHEMAEFEILRGVIRVKISITTLDSGNWEESK